MDQEPTEPTDEELDAAARQIEADLASLRLLVRIKKRTEFSAALILAAIALRLLLTFLLPHQDDIMVGVALLYIVTIFGGMGALYYSKHQYRRGIEGLRHLSDVNCLSALLDLLYSRQDVPHDLRPPLRTMLNQVQASDGFRLNAGHRRKLYAMLGPDKAFWMIRNDNDLKLAILRALEQIGDNEAIPHVERLRTQSQDAEVREAAANCLLFLRQRAEQKSVSGTLLRPSDAENAAPETLLRASISRPEDASDRLLRSTIAPDAEEHCRRGSL